MARPTKNYCDYFSHDAGMRNHKKIKAVRSKFGISGYAIWSMVLEYLTGNDGNVFEYSDMEFELMSGDFGVSATEIRDVVNYCITLELLHNDDGFIKSESLDERLAPVYQKRGVAKELAAKQRRVAGKFVTNNAESNGVSVTEMPQSKVKESKVNKTKPKQSPPRRGYVVPFLDDCFVAWESWEKHRKEIKKKLTPSTAEKQIKFLEGRAGPEIIAIIEHSIRNGYTGLFELKDAKNGNRNGSKETTRTVDAIIEPGQDFGVKKGF